MGTLFVTSLSEKKSFHIIVAFKLLLFSLGILSTPPSLVVVKAAGCGLRLPSQIVRFIVLPYPGKFSQN
jgi:hypothetical protein